MVKEKRGMVGALWIVGFVVVWVLLQAWILPRLGVST
jgi:hypothetical protein